MIFQENPYYSPELCGLRILTSVDTGASYEFDMTVVWEKLDDNTLWWDSDAGCSCPVPFDLERHNLRELTLETFYNFEKALNEHYNLNESEKIEVLNKVRNFLQNKNNK